MAPQPQPVVHLAWNINFPYNPTLVKVPMQIRASWSQPLPRTRLERGPEKQALHTPLARTLKSLLGPWVGILGSRPRVPQTVFELLMSPARPACVIEVCKLAASYPPTLPLTPIWKEKCLKLELNMTLLRRRQLFDKEHPTPRELLETPTRRPRTGVAWKTLLR